MRLLSGLALVLALGACDTTAELAEVDVRDLSQDPAALVGTWEWEGSTYFYTVSGEPVAQTPASTDSTETLAFRTDGFVEIVQRGEVAAVEAYEIRRLAYGNGTESDTPHLFVGGRPTPFGIDGRRLYIDDRAVDGPLSQYRKR